MFLDTLLYIDKIDEIKCDVPDIPIINMDNALVYILEGGTNIISYGLIFHKDQYYFFDRDVISIKGSYRYNMRDQFSYRVRPITSELGEKMVNDQYVQHWELVLSAFFYYGKTWLIYNNGVAGIKSFEYLSKMDRGLVIPRSLSPAVGYVSGMTIGEFLLKNKMDYSNNKSRFIINIPVHREHLLNKILCL